MKKLFIYTVLIVSLSSALFTPPAFASDNGTGLHGTVWKIVSWATNDQYVGFYEGDIYYLTGHDYIGTYLLEDSFYRDYEYYSLGAGVVPERLVNYPGDLVFWGVLFCRYRIGMGEVMPLPVSAFLFQKEADWAP